MSNRCWQQLSWMERSADWGCKLRSRGGVRDERRRRWKKKRRRWTGVGPRRCREKYEKKNLMCIQRPRFIGSPPIHPLSELDMWVVKRIRFDEPYASTVSDRSYAQHFKKSTFDQLPNLSRLEIKNYLNNWDITTLVLSSCKNNRCWLGFTKLMLVRTQKWHG